MKNIFFLTFVLSSLFSFAQSPSSTSLSTEGFYDLFCGGKIPAQANSLIKRDANGYMFATRIYFPQNNSIGTSGSSQLSMIYRNPTIGREELLLNAGKDSYSTDHDGSSIHLYGNNDSKHPGAISLLTGGLGRLMINRHGQVAVGGTSLPYDSGTSPGNNLFDYLDNGQTGIVQNPGLQDGMDGVFNIWRPSGKPALYIEGASVTEGDIAYKSGEAFSLGVWDHGPKIFTEYFHISSTGTVGLRTSHPSAALDVNGETIAFAYTTLGDIRFKKDITLIDNALSKALALNGVFFNWNTIDFPEKHFSDKRQLGFIAKEVEQIIPELVDTNKEGIKTIDYQQLTVVLLEAVKEQQEEIDRLKEKMDIVDHALNSLLEY